MRSSRAIRRRPATTTLAPNPQMVRGGWVSLDGPWQFAVGDAQAPAAAEWDRVIQTPFAPETPASGINETGLIPGCWYRRRFRSPGLAAGGTLLLRFGAVDYDAAVWVNGQLVATHEGGYTPFEADIGRALRRGENELVIRALDDPLDLAKPRGKQDWQPQPHSIWYPRTTGIWQSVWLEPVAASYIERAHWTADVPGFSLRLDGKVHSPRPGQRLAVRLRAGQRVLAEDECSVGPQGEVRRTIGLHDGGIDDVRDELLWRPGRPTLIHADLELRDARGAVLDSVVTYTAMRSVGTSGGQFLLNGRPLYLRLVLDQGYWPQSGLTPPDDVAARRDVELVKAMGFNGIRAHQRIADPRSLYWADALGLLVWEEMPSPYRFTPLALRRVAAQWSAAINRDRSHPCIIAWVPINESWGLPDLPARADQRHAAKAMYHLTKALDDTRPVIGNDGWEMCQTDIIAIHDYDASPQRIRRRYASDFPIERLLATQRPGHRALVLEDDTYRGQPVMLTEFGGISLRQEGTWGYSQAQSPADLANRYAELLAVVHELGVFAGFCYTQFADTYQEANGLLYASREPKFSLEDMSAATAGTHP